MTNLVNVGELLVAAKKSWDGHGGIPDIVVKLESEALLYGNATQVESIVGNLLSNAIRHTPGDGTVTMTWRSDKKGAEIIVEDTGEGIAAEHIPRLTERFFRVDRGRSRDDGGVGLGLAIVKHILNRHDGEIRITSQPDVGSEFRCRFAAARVAEPQPAAVAGGTKGG